jgi:cellobiose phosphorylase
VREGAVAVDGGWRIYSSGPGLYTKVLLQHAFGIRRHFGERIAPPLLPRSLGRVTLETIVDGRRHRSEISPA